MEVEFEGRGGYPPKPFVPTKAKPSKAKVKAFVSFKSKSDTQPKLTNDVKCFRC